MEIDLPLWLRYSIETTKAWLLLRIFPAEDRQNSGVRSAALLEAYSGDLIIKLSHGTKISPESEDNGTILRILPSHDNQTSEFQDAKMSGSSTGSLPRPGATPAVSSPAPRVSTRATTFAQPGNSVVPGSAPAPPIMGSAEPKWALHLTNCPLSLLDIGAWYKDNWDLLVDASQSRALTATELLVAFPSVSELNRATSRKLQNALQTQAPGILIARHNNRPQPKASLASSSAAASDTRPPPVPRWAFICQYPMGAVYPGRQTAGFTRWLRNYSTAKVRVEDCQQLSNTACLLAFESPQDLTNGFHDVRTNFKDQNITCCWLGPGDPDPIDPERAVFLHKMTCSAVTLPQYFSTVATLSRIVPTSPTSAIVELTSTESISQARSLTGVPFLMADYKPRRTARASTPMELDEPELPRPGTSKAPRGEDPPRPNSRTFPRRRLPTNGVGAANTQAALLCTARA